MTVTEELAPSPVVAVLVSIRDPISIRDLVSIRDLISALLLPLLMLDPTSLQSVDCYQTLAFRSDHKC